jgi:hypothetical protein
MVLAAAKLVLNVDVLGGNQTASAYAQPTLWGWLEARERNRGRVCCAAILRRATNR